MVGNAVRRGTTFAVCRRAVFGCPHLVLSDRAWITSNGDDVMVRCNDTLETWYLSCQGNHWIGYYDNCTSARELAGPFIERLFRRRCIKARIKK